MPRPPASRPLTLLRRSSKFRNFHVTSSRKADTRSAWPVTSTCPAPDCACIPTPEGLDIKRGPMAFPSYSAHIVIRTGRSDWASRIEDEESSIEGNAEEGKSSANLARALKELTGPGGKYYDPDRRYLVTNSSDGIAKEKPGTNSAYIWPRNVYIKGIRNTPEDHDMFVREQLLDEEGRQRFEERERLIQKNVWSNGEDIDISNQQQAPKAKRPVSLRRYQHRFSINDRPKILVCSHGGRDSRCGTMGPLINREIFRYITHHYRQSVELKESSKEYRGRSLKWKPNEGVTKVAEVHGANVAMISHIGGHAWAGNVVIYFPQKQRLANQQKHPLAGKGVWYGRVEPRHVCGIIEETVKNGVVIEELLRGVWTPPPRATASEPTKPPTSTTRMSKRQIARNRRAEKQIQGPEKPQMDEQQISKRQIARTRSVVKRLEIAPIDEPGIKAQQQDTQEALDERLLDVSETKKLLGDGAGNSMLSVPVDKPLTNMSAPLALLRGIEQQTGRIKLDYERAKLNLIQHPIRKIRISGSQSNLSQRKEAHIRKEQTTMKSIMGKGEMRVT